MYLRHHCLHSSYFKILHRYLVDYTFWGCVYVTLKSGCFCFTFFFSDLNLFLQINNDSHKALVFMFIFSVLEACFVIEYTKRNDSKIEVNKTSHWRSGTPAYCGPHLFKTPLFGHTVTCSSHFRSSAINFTVQQGQTCALIAISIRLNS